MDSIPFASFVGVVVEAVYEGSSSCSLALGPDHRNSRDMAHGGVAFTLADSCMGMALRSLLAPGEAASTIEAKISYFRPGAGRIMRTDSKVVHMGRSIAFVESKIMVDDSLIGAASGTFAIRRKSTK